MLFLYIAAVQACCPEIDDKSSIIAAYPDYLARVELLVNWGNCTASSSSFVYVIIDSAIASHSLVN